MRDQPHLHICRNENYYTNRIINVNHPRETFARAKTPRGLKNSNVGSGLSGCFFLISRVTLILKSITGLLLFSLLYNVFIFVYLYITCYILQILKKAISRFCNTIFLKRYFRSDLYQSLIIDIIGY